MEPEKDLNELAKRVRDAGGANVRAIVLYGSAASNEFQKEQSDLNVLCLVDRLDAGSLRGLRPVALWWWRKGHPAPLLFTLEELRESADVFAIELLDMKQRHRMLWGEDFLADLVVPMDLHRLQVERELRTSVIRLRQAYLRSRGRRAELGELMVASASSFASLFRHSLIALGEVAPEARRAAADRLAHRLGFDAAAFHAVLDLRERVRRVDEIDVERTFAGYLEVITRVAQEMDRCLAPK
jgi:predicted nucleotidyltransferase